MKNTFTYKDKIVIILFSILNIIGYVCYIILNFISDYKNTDYVNYYTQQITNIYMIIFFIWWIGVLGLIFYSLKGIWSCYKWKGNYWYYVISLIIFIIYSILYYPLYVFPLSTTVWIITAFLGSAFTLFFISRSTD